MIRLTFCATLISIVSYSIGQTSFNQITIGQDSAEYFLQKGLLEKQNGRKMESLKNFEKALGFDAKNKQILSELATAYFDLRKYDQSRLTYKKIEDLGDVTPALIKQILTLSFQIRNFDEALIYADKLKKADPSEKVAYYFGKINYDQENYGEAIKNLNQAAKEDPANAEVPYMIARSYADMMNYKLAVPFFQKAIELKPTEANWIYELGLICYAMHDDKNSLKYILDAGEKGYKKDNDYLENLGIAYLNVGDLDAGVKILGQILAKRPSDMNLLNMIAEAYYYKSKYDLAIDYWDKILEYDKTNASALYMIGMAYQKKGGDENMKKGTRLCDTAINMDPSLSNLRQKKMMAGL
ncbi:MAG: tetratricopeptide repeat protein [Bacteroidetes bacterium]|nr:tetratricopeptide repeat protein [Bacteroidota bacterium]